MLETLGSILLGVLCIATIGLVIVGYVAWRNHRRAENVKLAASGGGGGPKEPA